MNSRGARQVRWWYPRQWRARYGDELVALLEDLYGEHPLPVRCRLSLMYSGTIERGREVWKHRRTYTAYSIACAIVWAGVLAVVWANTSQTTRHTYTLVCSGWFIGWLSATIARVVYPPPRKWRTHQTS